ncbi:unnamed protein product, partial [Ixodes hexagonus]
MDDQVMNEKNRAFAFLQNNRPLNVFSRAFEKQNIYFETGKTTTDLRDFKMVETIKRTGCEANMTTGERNRDREHAPYGAISVEAKADNPPLSGLLQPRVPPSHEWGQGVPREAPAGGWGRHEQEALQSSMALMRKLLVDAQAKFRNMMEDNKALASRIDGDLHQRHSKTMAHVTKQAHQEVSQLRAELQDTNSRIANMAAVVQAPPTSQGSASCSVISSYVQRSPAHKGSGSPPKHCPRCQGICASLDERLSRLLEDKEQLAQHNLNLQKELDELRGPHQKALALAQEDHDRVQEELNNAKEALAALKQDRKRLKAEKFDLLNQMKQLYGTLEDKEQELRDFIRNYEQRMHDSDQSLKQLAQEREECDRERWSLLKHARDESERCVALRAQLGLKEAHIKQLQEQLQQAQEKLSYMSDAESLRGVSNGFQSSSSRRSCCSPAHGGPTPPVVAVGYDSSPKHHASGCLLDSPKKSPVSVCSAAALPGLSRSAEEIYQSSGSSDTSAAGALRGVPGKPKKRRDGRSPWGSISRVFLRNRQRKALEPGLYHPQRQRSSWSPQGSGPSLPLGSGLEPAECVAQERLLEEAQGTPMERWRAPTVLAWLEMALAMPMYGPMCAENIKSGKILLELSDTELESCLGITNVMHRRKLRLAIEEHREPSICPYPKMCLVTHTWVCGEWLCSLGLPAYGESFREHLVDGRVLDTLSRRDLEKRLGVSSRHHQASLLRGVQLLRTLRFDLRALAHRRALCRHLDVDPVVWTNQRFVQWARSIDLGEYAENLRESGVHGALVVLEPSFSAETMAQALGIPSSKNIIRRHLTTELENLVQPARMSLEAEAVVESKGGSERRLASATGSLGRSFARSSRARSSDRQTDKRRSSIRVS